MIRWVGVLTVAVVGLLAVLGWNRHAAGAGDAPGETVKAEPPAVAAAAAPAAVAQLTTDPADSVRIAHELVQARAVVSPVPARVALVARTPRAETRRDSRRFVQRASRMIVGDGRYRPEPFPRPAAR